MDRLSKRRHARRRERQVAEHRTEARRIVFCVSGVAKCFSCSVERPLEDRVKPSDLTGRETEAGGVEHVVKARDVPTAIGPGSVGAVVARIAQNVSRFDSPSAFRDGRGQVGSRHHTVPEFGWRHRSRQHAGAPDDGDRREGAHRSARVMHRPVGPHRSRARRLPRRSRLGRSAGSTVRRRASAPQHRGQSARRPSIRSGS